MTDLRTAIARTVCAHVPPERVCMGGGCPCWTEHALPAADAILAVLASKATEAGGVVERLQNDVCLFSRLDWQDHVALAREAAAVILALQTEIAALKAREPSDG